MTAYHQPLDQSELDDARSIGQVVGDVMGNAQEIIRGEMRLAKAEIRQEVTDVASSGSMLAAGAVVALFAFQMLLFTAAWVLNEAMPLWLAFAIVTLVVGAAAAGLIVVGRSRLEALDLKPTQTIESVKETAEWLKHPKPSV